MFNNSAGLYSSYCVYMNDICYEYFMFLKNAEYIPRVNLVARLVKSGIFSAFFVNLLFAAENIPHVFCGKYSAFFVV